MICTFIDDGILPQKLEVYEAKTVDEVSVLLSLSISLHKELLQNQRLDTITKDFIANCVEINLPQGEVNF